MAAWKIRPPGKAGFERESFFGKQTPFIMKRASGFRFSALIVMTVLFAPVSLMYSSEEASAEGHSPWTDDFTAALEQGRTDGRYLLLNFTGSDWCVWCHRLRDEVFVQDAFLDYAAESLVLVEVDFPMKKVLPDSVQAQNAELDERFDVSGYPTIVIVSPDNEEIGRLSYMQGGAKTFVRAVKKLIRKAESEEKASA